MKPVLETIIDKNGGETTRFNPSARMLLFAMKKAENQGLGDGEVAELAGIDRQLPGRWASKYGSRYISWLEEFIDSSPMGNELALLERVGMIHALQSNNFSYWQSMAKVKGLIKDEPANLSITLNTDFSQILVGDIHEARRRILQETRGLVIEGGSRMVTSSGVGEREGAGSGACEVQDGSLALSHKLGSDGGCPEQGASLPAIPEQTSPSTPDRVLAKRKVPAGT